MSIVRTSAIASLTAQFVIGAVTAIAFFVDVKSPRDREDLNVILVFEVTSQVIEFLWYATVLATSQTITARLRYIDWVLSTPTMIVSFAMFFRHRDDSITTGRSVTSVFQTYELYASLAMNWIMLALGFALESGHASNVVGLGGGGLALVGSFTFLAMFVDDDDVISRALFWTTFAIWGLYGVAAALDDVPKNVAYNLIDVVSKNGFGVFLFVYALTL